VNSHFLKRFIFCFIIFLIPTKNVFAACGLSISANDINVTWTTTWTIQSVSITVSKTNPAECTFGLSFSKGVAGSYTRYGQNGASSLHYQLYQDSGGTRILKDVPDALTVNDVIMVTLPAGSGPQIVQFYFDIPYSLATTPLLAAAGTYTDNIVISAYEGVDPSIFTAPADASTSFNLTMNIDKQINLSFVDLGGYFQENATTKAIDFGKLIANHVSRFNLAVRTNAGFRITIVSTNNGRFKHSLQNSYVPYSIYVNNSVADVTGVTPVATGSGQTSLAGLIYPIKIVVGAVGVLALAGNYTDTITVTAIVTD
jgi:spore coat protein U-like protein